MYSDRDRRAALAEIRSGYTLSAVSRRLGMSRSTLRAWRDDPARGHRRSACPRCDDFPLDHPACAAVLGYYLGDGCVSRLARCYTLRVSCDATYSGIVADVEQAITRRRPGYRTYRVGAPGVIVVQSSWMHWPCLLPQHGPSRKHERVLGMKSWQWGIVERTPADYLRGLFHSDGCRVNNWALQVVAGQKKRYEYPRWHFTNESAEIMGWCQDALDLVGIPWRQSSRRILLVSRREAVSRLDELIGPKR